MPCSFSPTLAWPDASWLRRKDTFPIVAPHYEVRVWHTQTRQGKRTFQTKLDEWPWASPDGGHLVRDLSGDPFRLPPVETLDEKTLERLWAYVG